MSKNNVSFGFGVTGTDHVALRKRAQEALIRRGFKRVTPSFFQINHMDPAEVYNVVEEFNLVIKTSGLDASLRFISVNAFRDFSMNIHFGKMK